MRFCWLHLELSWDEILLVALGDDILLVALRAQLG